MLEEVFVKLEALPRFIAAIGFYNTSRTHDMNIHDAFTYRDAQAFLSNHLNLQFE